MQNVVEHETNLFHALVIELQEAKKCGFIFQIQFLDHDILILMDRNLADSKICEVADHINKKYRVHTTMSLYAKTIKVFDAYMLDPKV